MTVESVFKKVSGYLADESLMRTLITAFIICIGCFLLAGLLRLISGKRGTAVGAVTATLDILVLCALLVVLPLYISGSEKYLPALPFASTASGAISLMPVPELSRDLLSAQLVYLIIMAFLFGLAESLLPETKNFFVWVLLRLLTIVLVCAVLWVIQNLLASLLPGFIQNYAPILLLTFLALLLALTVFKWFFGLILGVSCGPVIGAVYTFIAGNIIGKQLAKAALTCTLIIALLLLAHRSNITIINLSNMPIFFSVLTVSAPIIARYLISKLY